MTADKEDGEQILEADSDKLPSQTTRNRVITVGKENLEILFFSKVDWLSIMQSSFQNWERVLQTQVLWALRK